VKGYNRQKRGKNIGQKHAGPYRSKLQTHDIKDIEEVVVLRKWYLSKDMVNNLLAT
jgi:hypothetical protein